MPQIEICDPHLSQKVSLKINQIYTLEINCSNEH